LSAGGGGGGAVHPGWRHCRPSTQLTAADGETSYADDDVTLMP